MYFYIFLTSKSLSIRSYLKKLIEFMFSKKLPFLLIFLHSYVRCQSNLHLDIRKISLFKLEWIKMIPFLGQILTNIHYWFYVKSFKALGLGEDLVDDCLGSSGLGEFGTLGGDDGKSGHRLNLEFHSEFLSLVDVDFGEGDTVIVRLLMDIGSNVLAWTAPAEFKCIRT